MPDKMLWRVCRKALRKNESMKSMDHTRNLLLQCMSSCRILERYSAQNGSQKDIYLIDFGLASSSYVRKFTMYGFKLVVLAGPQTLLQRLIGHEKAIRHLGLLFCWSVAITHTKNQYRWRRSSPPCLKTREPPVVIGFADSLVVFRLPLSWRAAACRFHRRKTSLNRRAPERRASKC